MDGTFAVWDSLVGADIATDKFNMDDLMTAVNICVRSKMYNRIDYSDIYTVAIATAKERKKKEKIKADIDRRANTPKGKPMPESIKNTLSNLFR